MIDLLRKYTQQFMSWYRVSHQVQSVLSKILLCRTAVLRGHVNYFQVVFTLPDRFSSLILGNRRELYNLLFRSAWQSLDTVLRQEGKFHPAALMVLHT